MTVTAASDAAFVYTDIQGLAGLRNKARQHSPDAAREAAQQFEAVFIQMMLKSMRTASSSEGGIMDNDQSRMYLELFDQQLALSMAKQGQLGLADQIVKQLGGESAAQPPRPTSATAIGDPLATLRQVERIRSSVAMPVTASIRTAAANDAGPGPADPVSDAPFEPSSPAAFVRRMWPHAQQAASQLGVAPEVLIAQAAHETAWGKSMPRFADGRSSNNLFGIKANRSWQGERVVNSTLEFVGGVPVRQRDGFRAYASYADSFNDYARFIQSNPRYGEALNRVEDGAAYLRALQQAGYATDPGYARKIQALMDGPAFDEALDALKPAALQPIPNSRG